MITVREHDARSNERNYKEKGEHFVGVGILSANVGKQDRRRTRRERAVGLMVALRGRLSRLPMGTFSACERTRHILHSTPPLETRWSCIFINSRDKIFISRNEK